MSTTIERLIQTGLARVIATRRNTMQLVSEDGPVLTRSGRPVSPAVQERLIAVWRGAGRLDSEPAFFIRERTRRGWHFDPIFGTLDEVWREEGPIVERYELASLQETWGRGRGWHVGT